MVINFFMRLNDINSFHLISKGVLAIISIIFIWYSFLKIGFIKNNFDRFISKIGIRAMFKNQHNPIMILGIFKSEVIAEVIITNLPEELLEIKLKDSNVRHRYNLQFLTVVRNEDNSIPITGETILETQDRVIIFGNLKDIKRLFIIDKIL